MDPQLRPKQLLFQADKIPGDSLFSSGALYDIIETINYVVVKDSVSGFRILGICVQFSRWCLGFRA